MLTTLAVTLAGHLRVAAIAVAAALLGVGGSVATVATAADSNPSAEPSAVAATLEPGDDQGEDVTEETNAPKKANAPKANASRKARASKAKAHAATGPAARPAELFDPVACAAAAHHGAYVSYVAHATKGMPDHGALVSAAAHSDCGKAAKAETAPKTKRPHKAYADPTAKKKAGNRSGALTKAGKKEGN